MYAYTYIYIYIYVCTYLSISLSISLSLSLYIYIYSSVAVGGDRAAEERAPHVVRRARVASRGFLIREGS